MSVLVWIPARGGSERIRGEHLRPVAGASLIGRTVWSARKFVRAAELDARIIVDTDDAAIRDEALRWRAEVPFVREPELAGGDAGSAETVLRCIERLAGQAWRPSAVVVLQSTSPLRDAAHLLECWERFSAGADRVISVRPADVELDAGVLMDGEGGLTRVSRPARGRRCCPSGAFYASTVSALVEERSFFVDGATVGVMTEGPSMVEVDYPIQLDLAEGYLLASRPAGDHPDRCFVIAEAGVNHNGDHALALELVDVAAEAGADFVKFQTFDPARLVSRAAPKANYQIQNTGTSESQYEMLQALTLPRDWHADLRERCEARGVGFLSTAFDEQSADFLVALGVDRIKVPSGEITNWPFLDHVGRLGLPVLLSTGMSTLHEVADGVERLEISGATDITILHCVSNYPTAPEDANLRAMNTLRALFRRPVGWSDHTVGIAFSVAAAALGAAVIEKHFTLDRNLRGPDHRASLEPGELAEMIRAVRDVRSGLGTGVKEPRPSEAPVAAVARKSLHAARDLEVGHTLASSDLIALRPGTGLPPSKLADVVGRALVRRLAFGEMLWEDAIG